ncbi:hypothetical protein AMTR_s00147p00021930 [Amborella trichopoda]|uniref:Uncharacterized protein n=1 Tax=Amborella trichopoda TaxID=13333 RepID=W1P9Q3_AMBTC|nr:hypothetical protein AMTR_s00147p00021930 [Amborella trichopoda]
MEYKTVFRHGGIPLTFTMMSERVELYERTKSLIAGIRSGKNQKITKQSWSHSNNRGKPLTTGEGNQIIINQPNRQNQNRNQNPNPSQGQQGVLNQLRGTNRNKSFN